MSGGTEGPADWLGILLGLGRRRVPGTTRKRGGCFPVLLVALAGITAGLVAAAHQAAGYL